MACGATLSLKRSLEFDLLHSPSQRTPKRRRCMPMTISPTVPPTKQHQLNPSPFSEVSPKYTSEQIAAQIGAELKRMQRRRQLQLPHASSSGSPSSSGSSSPVLGQQDGNSQLAQSSMSSLSFFGGLSPSKRDTPLFTFKQVSLVCDRMLKEREQQIREQYDKVLTCKLSEQYEAFLKFNHDQLHRRFGETAASYVS
ncbi:hypothetical protein NP493_103g06046 [Ridgeia piscesae]|uniref:Akirin 2 n=1 Tax=Ridgeia piscesae TaxID=27915 RepID=A0AAD9P7D6_RIDPI|nr:hypothetical protein NP493_103g06046 [Ridgeia piscesae]